MSLHYSLLLQQEVTFETNFKSLLQKYDISAGSIADIPKGRKIETPDFTISITDTSDMPFGWESELLREEYPYIQSIGFRLDKNSDLVQAGSEILEIALGILKGVSKALFLLNDSVVFYWDGVNLLINNEFGFWDIERRLQIIGDRVYSTF
ncbi:SitI3 family protein [Paenibacillus sp. NEAU-GSW1]|uniref:SitI3 family protein n=1 Tax=Paenibacillus sp. NEAU-GSW1 TaxID=2682486 RepID=UPI0012E2263C|nr:SitI3 family protein [Paenibacillus sp. NEAU-GSW1]MUT65615.1 hypothetical protein [Paenibacillus sp. NEAU-GSW1]